MSGRRGRRERRTARQPAPRAPAPSYLSLKLPPYQFLDAQGLELIVETSLYILETIGLDFLDAETCQVLRAAGAQVEGERVRFPRELVEECIALAPRQFTQLARNPDRSVVLGGNHMVFAPVYGPPYVFDRERGRRRATLEDLQNFIKLAHQSERLHHSGGVIVEPTDVPVPIRHLDTLFSHIKYSDRAFMGSVTAPENAQDSVNIAALLFGEEAIQENPAVLSLINVNSPLRYDDRMLGAMKVYARARQALVITPFILAGAMSPTTLAGTLAQQTAEALAGITFVQILNPGTPVVYGSFLSNIDMQSGSPCFGTPESALGLYCSAQLARRFGLPFRGGGAFTASKIPDGQAGYESLMTLLPTVQAGTNFVLHAAGWLEAGLCAGYEKFVLDNEVLGMMSVYVQGLELNEDAFALDAMEEVGPGGHFLGAQHTMRHFRTAFYRADLFDNKNYEQWEIDGALDAYARATVAWQRMLAEYEPPPLDPAIEDALLDYINGRKRELEASLSFDL